MTIPFETVPDHLQPTWTPIIMAIGRVLDQFKLLAFQELNLRTSTHLYDDRQWFVAVDQANQRQWVEIAAYSNFRDQLVTFFIRFYPTNDAAFEQFSCDIRFRDLHEWIMSHNVSPESMNELGMAMLNAFSRIPATAKRQKTIN
jgi:hypothetical protein